MPLEGTFAYCKEPLCFNPCQSSSSKFTAIVLKKKKKFYKKKKMSLCAKYRNSVFLSYPFVYNGLIKEWFSVLLVLATSILNVKVILFDSAFAMQVQYEKWFHAAFMIVLDLKNIDCWKLLTPDKAFTDCHPWSIFYWLCNCLVCTCDPTGHQSWTHAQHSPLHARSL